MFCITVAVPALHSSVGWLWAAWDTPALIEKLVAVQSSDCSQGDLLVAPRCRRGWEAHRVPSSSMEQWVLSQLQRKAVCHGAAGTAQGSTGVPEPAATIQKLRTNIPGPTVLACSYFPCWRLR